MLLDDCEEVAQQRVPLLAGNALRVELNSVDRQLIVAHRLDRLVLGARIDLQAIGQVGSVDHQRMVARDREGRRQAAEKRCPVVGDCRSLAVHHPRRPHDPATERLADRLVAKAHAEQRPTLGCTGRDQIETDAGIVRAARARRYQEAVGSASQRLVDADRVAPLDPDLRPGFPQIMDQVPGEAVMIVDDEDQGRRLTGRSEAAGEARRSFPRRG